MQRAGGIAETAVGLDGRVGAGDQDGDAVGVRQVAEDLRREAGAAAVEGEEVTGRVGHRPVRGGAFTAAVGRGHTGRLGGVGAVGRIRLVQRRRRDRREGGRLRSGYLGPRRTGQRNDHGTGDQGGEQRSTQSVRAARLPRPARRTPLGRRTPLARPAGVGRLARLGPLARRTHLARRARPRCPRRTPHGRHPFQSARPSGLPGREVTDPDLSSASCQGAHLRRSSQVLRV